MLLTSWVALRREIGVTYTQPVQCMQCQPRGLFVRFCSAGEKTDCLARKGRSWQQDFLISGYNLTKGRGRVDGALPN
jgi:hypothetical protein